MSDTVRQTETLSEDRAAQRIMLDQQLALSAYLHALLQPASAETIAPAEPTRVVAAPTAVPMPAAEVAAAECGVTAVGVTEVLAAAEAAAVPASMPDEHAAEFPDWAQHDFQCLLFRVAGLTLALPLAKLNGVLPWDAAAVTTLPNHRPWFLGLREHLGHQVKLIDVAKVVLPSDRGAADGDGTGYGKIILIDDGRWGLVCSEVAEVVTLSAGAVKWRSRCGSRPWLAGTVIDHMCALLDSTALAEMLGGAGPENVCSG